MSNDMTVNCGKIRHQTLAFSDLLQETRTTVSHRCIIKQHKKQWILFAPNEDLQPTRIPYEESSIYSKINMFANPDPNDFTGIVDCRSVTLNPGDVLVVPHKWWHYVENLELAISINMWIDLPIDHEERVNESIVQLLISQLSGGLPAKHISCVLNPGSDLDDINLIDAFNLTETCIKKYKENEQSCSTVNVEQIIEEIDNVEIIRPLKDDELKQLLKDKAGKKNYNVLEEAVDDGDRKIIRDYLNAILHEDVINTIKNKLLKHFLF